MTNPSGSARSLWDRLTAPSPLVSDPGDRRSARLLAGLLLSLTAVGLVSSSVQLLLVDGFLPTFRLIAGAMLVLLLGYAVSRSASFRYAGAFAAAVPILTGSLVGLLRPTDVAWFAFLSLGMPLAAAFLPLRAVVGTALVSVAAGVAVVLAAGDAIPRTDVPAILSFLAAVSAIVVLGRRHLANVELDRKRSLQDAVTQYQSVFAHAPVGIGVSGPDASIVQANRALYVLLGHDEGPVSALPPVTTLYADPGTRDALLARMGRGESIVAEEVRLRHRDGHPVLTEMSLVPIQLQGTPHIIAIVEEVGQRRRLQAQLAQAQKMESVGRLAGGVAHDFNNLLTVIQANLDLALNDLGPSHPAADGIREASAAAVSASGVTRQLLAFSRQQVIEPRVVDVNALVRRIERLLRRLVGEHIDLRTALAEPIGAVRVDPSQLEQALVNLAANARDAMPDGGQLTIRTAETRRADPRQPAQEADFVSIAITDVGHGMSEEVLEHIFEPFFSTKPVGAGTGLGLSSVHGAVAQHGGTIDVRSSPGEGSTFTIHLPRVAAAATVDPEVEVPPRLEGDETILLVEDDPSLRRVAERALGRHGYRVLVAGDATAALRLLEEHEGPIHLLVTDVILPGMNGADLAQAVRLRRPSVRVLHVSGYTADLIGRHGVLDAGVNFLAKPYSIATLARRIRALLDA